MHRRHEDQVGLADGVAVERMEGNAADFTFLAELVDISMKMRIACQHTSHGLADIACAIDEHVLRAGLLHEVTECLAVVIPLQPCFEHLKISCQLLILRRPLARHRLRLVIHLAAEVVDARIVAHNGLLDDFLVLLVIGMERVQDIFEPVFLFCEVAPIVNRSQNHVVKSIRVKTRLDKVRNLMEVTFLNDHSI